MYEPKGNGKDKAEPSVVFVETEPPEHLRAIVHRFLELKTTAPLAQDYRFHALPDACTYIVLDQLKPDIAGVSKLSAESEEFDLGTEFHFINIRLLPGVWQDTQEPVAFGQVTAHYKGALELDVLGHALLDADPATTQAKLVALIEHLLANRCVAQNLVTEIILRNLDDNHSVADMAELVGLSARQLQRKLKRTTGFAPHDFLKIMRLQQAISGNETSYADQSHFIHSFRNATGYTPGKYAKKFDI